MRKNSSAFWIILGLYFDAIFRIFDRLGLNFDAVNLTFSQIVGNMVFYNLWKFQIDSLQIKIRMNFVSLQIFFSLFGSARW